MMMNVYHKKYQIIEIYSLLFIDIICTVIAYYLTYMICFWLLSRARIQGGWLPVYFMSLFDCLFYNLAMKAHHHFFKRGYRKEMVFVLQYTLSLFVMLSTEIYVFQLELQFSRMMLGCFVLINALLTYAARLVFKKWIKTYYSGSKGSDKILVVTTEKELASVIDHIGKDIAWSYEIIGIALMDKDRVGEYVEDIPIVASEDNVIAVARQSALDVVFLYCSQKDVRNLEILIQSFLAMGILCHECVERVNLDAPYSCVGKFAGFPVMTYSMILIDYRRRVVKRLMDIIGGLVGLLITGVITPFVALAIKIDSKGPVIFSQIRIGKNGRRFKMYKFRSMYVGAEEQKKRLLDQNEMRGLMFKMDKDPRVTNVGKFLRKISLDELPQFWNVLKGDMSLVGTRPPTVDEFEQYNIYYRRRLSITPGMTGMWQVSGRSDIIDFDEVVRMDLKYIDELTLRKDVRILLQTVGKVLLGKGAK